MDFSGLKHLPTTIPGLLVLAVVVGGATYALARGLCTFEEWKGIAMAALAIVGSIAGGGLLMAGGAKPQALPPPGFTDSSADPS